MTALGAPGARPTVDSDRPAEAVRQPVSRRRRFSMLSLRILAPNMVALGILAGGVFYLDRYRDGLLDERIASLQTQAEMMAGALGETAVTDSAGDRKLEPVMARAIVSRLVVPTRTRARLYDRAGRMIADSRELVAAGRSVVLRYLPPPGADGTMIDLLERLYDWLLPRLPQGRAFPPYIERVGEQASNYGEVISALSGETDGAIRALGDGSLILTVAVPVQPLRHVVGALLLSADSADIEDKVREARLGILQAFALALAATILLSVFLAGTIARPVRRLAEAADRVRQWRGRRPDIPDLSRRQDEIGDLSRALGDMTHALYARMDAIEAFAADVAHEIKNPLSSLRSALETVNRTDDPERRRRLLDVMAQDVRRLDRLISDITNASRIDAEMARTASEPVELVALLETVVTLYSERLTPGQVRFELDVPPDGTLTVEGVSGRLGQVVDNLVSNAVSFSPPGGLIRLSVRREDGDVVLTVEDEGPGIPEGKEEAIFQRFYSQRPRGERFGQHSGLGLSICRQIADAHGGSIRAQNRYDHSGARFILRLPA